MRRNLRTVFRMLVPRKTLVTSSSLTHVCKFFVFMAFFTFMSICVVLFFQLISIAVSTADSESSAFDLLILTSSSQTSSEEKRGGGRSTFFASLGLTDMKSNDVEDGD